MVALEVLDDIQGLDTAGVLLPVSVKVSFTLTSSELEEIFALAVFPVIQLEEEPDSAKFVGDKAYSPEPTKFNAVIPVLAPDALPSLNE